jgi:DNA-binding response OmpR family regulator
MKVLIGDAPDDALLLSHSIEKAGYRTVRAYTTHALLDCVKWHHPDLIVMESATAAIDGFQVCQRIRKTFRGAIIFVSKSAHTTSIVKGLRSGGDDYLCKPYEPSELLTRMQAVLRRYSVAAHIATTTIDRGQFKFEPLSCSVTRNNGSAVKLAPIEFRLIYLLATHAEQTMSAAQLLRGMGLALQDKHTNLIAQYIYQLRRKLEGAIPRPQHIITVSKVGYKFVP